MLKINAPTQFLCFSQKLTYLNTAFSLTFVEERIGCSSEEYSEKEKKQLSRKKRKAAWNPEVGERNSTDLTDSPRNEKEKTQKILLKTPSQFGLQVFFITKNYPAVQGWTRRSSGTFPISVGFFCSAQASTLGVFYHASGLGSPNPHSWFFLETKGFSKPRNQRVNTPPGSGPVSMTLASEMF